MPRLISTWMASHLQMFQKSPCPTASQRCPSHPHQESFAVEAFCDAAITKVSCLCDQVMRFDQEADGHSCSVLSAA